MKTILLELSKLDDVLVNSRSDIVKIRHLIYCREIVDLFNKINFLNVFWDRTTISNNTVGIRSNNGITIMFSQYFNSYDEIKTKLTLLYGETTILVNYNYMFYGNIEQIIAKLKDVIIDKFIIKEIKVEEEKVLNPNLRKSLPKTFDSQICNLIELGKLTTNILNNEDILYEDWKFFESKEKSLVKLYTQNIEISLTLKKVTDIFKNEITVVETILTYKGYQIYHLEFLPLYWDTTKDNFYDKIITLLSKKETLNNFSLIDSYR